MCLGPMSVIRIVVSCQCIPSYHALLPTPMALLLPKPSYLEFLPTPMALLPSTFCETVCAGTSSRPGDVVKFHYNFKDGSAPASWLITNSATRNAWLMQSNSKIGFCPSQGTGDSTCQNMRLLRSYGDRWARLRIEVVTFASWMVCAV
jgi:hypothetical protein